ncbi:hypothetical protein QL285_052749 [Trifolium repens]|nr:hypothetical protein QL285_052749 [Trifolium repens]
MKFDSASASRSTICVQIGKLRICLPYPNSIPWVPVKDLAQDRTSDLKKCSGPRCIQIAKATFQLCIDSPWRMGTRSGELDREILRSPGLPCGRLRSTGGKLRSPARSCGVLRDPAGACGKAAGACGKAAGACGKAAVTCGSLQQGAATPREILFQARIQARGLSEFRYKRL